MKFGRLLVLVVILIASGALPEARAAVFYPTSFTLANGLQVVVVPNRLAPVVTQMVWYRVGSADEVPGKTGLAHYLEHLMFRGTAQIGAGDFSKLIAAQGGNDNAFTSYDYTAYHETVAADRLPMIMQMEADRMQNLRILPETAMPELSVVLDERQQRTDNSPEGRFEEKVNHLLLPRHPYGTPVIGWKKEIERLTPDDARRFYERHYAPNNAVVVVLGDVDVDNVMRLAAAIYGAVPKRVLPARRALPPMPEPKQKRFTVVDAGIEQPQIQLKITAPSYATQTGRQAYAYEVLANVLDSGEVGLLYRTLVKDKGLASGVATDYDPDARGDTVLTIEVTPKPGQNPANVAKALRETLAGFAAAPQGLTGEVVAAAKERLKRSALFARDSLMMPGYAFGMALSTGHTVADVEDWPQRIDAVTAEDVNTALRDLVANPHYILASLLPDPKASAAARDAARPVAGAERGIR